jgi:hypothetical protein
VRLAAAIAKADAGDRIDGHEPFADCGFADDAEQGANSANRFDIDALAVARMFEGLFDPTKEKAFEPWAHAG